MVKETGGGIIRKLRIEKGFSIKELAERANVHYVFLSRLERNKETPSEDLINRLAIALDYKGNINMLIGYFGRIPEEIKKMIIDDPQSMAKLPAFFKSRKGGIKNEN